MHQPKFRKINATKYVIAKIFLLYFLHISKEIRQILDFRYNSCTCINLLAKLNINLILRQKIALIYQYQCIRIIWYIKLFTASYTLILVNFAFLYQTYLTPRINASTRARILQWFLKFRFLLKFPFNLDLQIIDNIVVQKLGTIVGNLSLKVPNFIELFFSSLVDLFLSITCKMHVDLKHPKFVHTKRIF